MLSQRVQFLLKVEQIVHWIPKFVLLLSEIGVLLFLLLQPFFVQRVFITCKAAIPVSVFIVVGNFGLLGVVNAFSLVELLHKHPCMVSCVLQKLNCVLKPLFISLSVFLILFRILPFVPSESPMSAQTVLSIDAFRAPHQLSAKHDFLSAQLFSRLEVRQNFLDFV